MTAAHMKLAASICTLALSLLALLLLAGPASAGPTDTSTVGSHTYSVTATSGNGLTGTSEISFEVAKARPALTAVEPTSSATIGQGISVKAQLTGGTSPTGELVFIALGPDDTRCRGPVAWISEPVPVSGNGVYPSPEFTPTDVGVYRWGIRYSGDEMNENADYCGVTSTVKKSNSSLLATNATSAKKGQPITFSAALAAGPEPSGSITFTAFGPNDNNCSAAPAFTSSPVPVTAGGPYESPEFNPADAGTYRWRASYSGDPKNEATSTACGDEGSISTVTDPVPPPVCPAVQLDFTLRRFKPNGSRAKNELVPGVLVKIRAGADVDAKLRMSLKYRAGKKVRTAKLRTRTVRVNGARRMVVAVPGKVTRDLRRTTGRVYRHEVTLRVGAKLKPRVTANECFQDAGSKKLRSRIIGVSVRNAIRIG